jgi:alkyl sulfatase BDS1-like metallo-beta-lactamase superfamily hydrolase
MTAEQLFDVMAIRVKAPECWNERLTIDVTLTDDHVTYRLERRNGVLVYSSARHSAPADATVARTRPALLGVATGRIHLDAFGDAGIEVDCDESTVRRLHSVVQEPDPDFPVLTPARP